MLRHGLRRRHLHAMRQIVCNSSCVLPAAAPPHPANSYLCAQRTAVALSCFVEVGYSYCHVVQPANLSHRFAWGGLWVCGSAPGWITNYVYLCCCGRGSSLLLLLLLLMLLGTAGGADKAPKHPRANRSSQLLQARQNSLAANNLQHHGVQQRKNSGMSPATFGLILRLKPLCFVCCLLLLVNLLFAAVSGFSTQNASLKPPLPNCCCSKQAVAVKALHNQTTATQLHHQQHV